MSYVKDLTAPRHNGWRPRRAMVLAAGLGLRMRPITETVPKPLVKVAGRTLLDRALDRLEDAKVEEAVVNVHYLGHHIEDHLADRERPRIILSREADLLETGGGIVKALPLLGGEPFYVVNADALWLNGYSDALLRLATRWNDAEMDGVLLLHSTVEAYGYDGFGDFLIDPAGKLARRPESEVSPYLFTGVQILHPRLFEGEAESKFSLNRLYDRAIAAGRLYGVVHDGEWFHVGTPEHLAETEAYMHAAYPGIQRRG